MLCVAASVLGCWVRRPPGELKVNARRINSLVRNWEEFHSAGFNGV